MSNLRVSDRVRRAPGYAPTADHTEVGTVIGLRPHPLSVLVPWPIGVMTAYRDSELEVAS